MNANFCVVALMVCLAGCGTESLSTPVHTSTLGRVLRDSTAAECPNGGSILGYGIDKNGNGVLEANETTGTLLICNGAMGPQGPAGPQGAAGPQGPNGLQGNTGPQGPNGIQGVTGPQGPDGIAGDTGPQGPNGLQGDTGSSGPRGSQGDAGPQGPNGVQGPKGDMGPAGATYAFYQRTGVAQASNCNPVNADASCDPNDVLVGGGCVTAADQWYFRINSPTSKTTYSCRAVVNNSTTDTCAGDSDSVRNASITATAICAHAVSTANIYPDSLAR